MKHSYDDIIDLPHHVSTKHPPMARENRAAQFAPFAALTGYEDAIFETARLTDQKTELTEEAAAQINRVLEELYTQRDFAKTYKIVYFKQDARKHGGEYVTVSERITDINPADMTITLKNRLVISFYDVFSICVTDKQEDKLSD